MKKLKSFLLGLTLVMTIGILRVNAAVLYGDVTVDGEVNSHDLTAMQKYVNGDKAAISEEGLKAADLNGDTKVDSKDVTILMRHLALCEGYETLPIASSVKVYEYGDVNLDDAVNSKDADALQKYVNGDKTAVSAEGLKLADLNGDTKVDKKDVTILMRHLALWKGYETLPIASSTIVYDYGDVNLDGVVNARDVSDLEKYVNGDKTAVSAEGLKLADLNSDGKVDNTDVIILMRHDLGKEGYETLPIPSSTIVYDYGDVNLDGVVNSKDVSALEKYVNGDKTAISTEGLKLADLNSDGKVDRTDIIILMRHEMGWEGYETLPLPSSVRVYEYGDVNLDGAVNSRDVSALKKYINGDKTAISAEGLKLADLNSDGKVDEEDILILMRYLLGMKGYETLPLKPSTTIAPSGDLNNDGKVDEKDLNIIEEWLNDKDNVSEENKDLADVNMDGEFNEDDIKDLKTSISEEDESNPKTLDNTLGLLIAGLFIAGIGTFALFKLKHN